MTKSCVISEISKSKYPGLSPDHTKSVQFYNMPHYATLFEDFINLEYKAELNVNPKAQRTVIEKARGTSDQSSSAIFA